MYVSVVSSLDPKLYLLMTNHHDRLFVMDLEAAQNSLGFYQTANGESLVLRHSSVQVPHKDHQPQRRIQKGSEKKNFKGSNCLPRKGADTTTDSLGKPPGKTQNKRQ